MRRNLIALWEFKKTNDTQLDAFLEEKFALIRSEASGWWFVENEAHSKGFVPANRFRFENSDCAIESILCDADSVDEENEEYFSNYGSNLKIQYEMVSDVPRNDAYHRAIENMRDLFFDRIVLDVGCGTSLLSLFCAKAGARHVYALEASDMADTARKIVVKNGLSDKITILNCAVKDADISVPVDIIISEWMGTMLFFESMIESVLLARDLWLKRDSGLILPRFASIWISLIDATPLWNDRVGFWSNVNGVDLSDVAQPSRDFFFSRPVIDVSPDDNMYSIVSNACKVYECDLLSMNVDELNDIRWCGELTLNNEAKPVHGIICWFEVCFAADCDVHNDIDWPSLNNSNPTRGRNSYLSTSVQFPQTHWRQSLLLFDEPISVASAQSVQVCFLMRRNKLYPRHYKIDLSASLIDATSEGDAMITGPRKEFSLWR